VELEHLKIKTRLTNEKFKLKKLFSKEQKNIQKRKKKKHNLLVPFSSPSGFPNGFSLISTRRVGWSLHGVPPVLSLVPEFYRVLDRFPQVKPFNSSPRRRSTQSYQVPIFSQGSPKVHL
jgi:hypothetical protein